MVLESCILMFFPVLWNFMQTLRNFDFPVTVLLKATCRKRKTELNPHIFWFPIKWKSTGFHVSRRNIKEYWSTLQETEERSDWCYKGAVKITSQMSPNRNGWIFCLVLNLTAFLPTSLGDNSFTMTKASIRPLTAHFWTILTHHNAPRSPKSESQIHQWKHKSLPQVN